MNGAQKYASIAFCLNIISTVLFFVFLIGFIILIAEHFKVWKICGSLSYQYRQRKKNCVDPEMYF